MCLPPPHGYTGMDELYIFALIPSSLGGGDDAEARKKSRKEVLKNVRQMESTCIEQDIHPMVIEVVGDDFTASIDAVQKCAPPRRACVDGPLRPICGVAHGVRGQGSLGLLPWAVAVGRALEGLCA